MSLFELTAPGSRPLVHFTPLRYPGGKAKLASYVKKLLKDNKLLDGEYVEPYAGGAAIALELLFHEYVSAVHINDVSRPIYAFWRSVLRETDELCRRLRDTKISVEVWDKQKRVFLRQSDYSDLDLGFATLFLNRTNRSGILNGGIIGGREQTGPWKIDARFNKDEIIYRIECIAKMAHRITLTRTDAVKFLNRNKSKWGAKTLIYLDPPYYEKGRDLYYDFYKHEDHASVADFVLNNLADRHWIVSYDNVPAIRSLYRGQQQGTYKIGYSARSAGEGSEVMFFGDKVRVSPLVGPVKCDGGFGEREGQRTVKRGDSRAPARQCHTTGAKHSAVADKGN